MFSIVFLGFCMYFLFVVTCLVVSVTAIDCLGRLVSAVTC